MTFVLTAQTDSTNDTPVSFPLLRSVATLLVCVLVPGGLVTVGLELLGQPIHAEVNLIAVGICVVGCIIGLLPVWFLSKQHRHGAAQGFMAGMILRVMVCVAGYLALKWGGYEHAKLVVYYLAGWYLVSLMVEVKLVSSFLLAHATPGNTPAPGNAPGNIPASGDRDSARDAGSAETIDQSATAPSGRVGLEGDV